MRARAAMRAELTAVVVTLALEHGYEQTTVDDICAAAEISRSTFFRYFPTKEDAVLSGLADAGERLREALVARPDEEPAWTALRHALGSLIDQYDGHEEKTRRLTRLIVTTPALAAKHREKNARWRELLRPEIARRLRIDSADVADPRPDAVVAAALGCVEATLAAWTAAENPRPLPEILERAMSVVR